MSIRFPILLAMFACIAAAASQAGAQLTDLQKQIDEAIAAGQRELTIAPGTYREAPPRAGRPHLRLAGVKDFTLIADGVTVLCTSPDQALKLEDCANVTIRGLTIDYDPLPWTQGVIVAMDPEHRWIDIRVDDGYPAAFEDTGRRAIVHDAQTRLVKNGTWTRHGVNVSPREDGLVRLSWRNPITDTTAVGDGVTLTRKVNTPHGVFVERSTDCTLQNVTLHATTSFGFFENHGGGNRYLGCRVIPGPPPRGATAPRLLSSQADSFHSKSTVRGPIVEGCTFDSMGDDGIAINGQFALVIESDGTRLVLSPHREMPFSAGDRIHGVKKGGVSTEDVKIVSLTPVEQPAVEGRAVQLEHWPELRLSEHLFKQQYELTLDRPLELSTGDLVASPDRNGSGFVARNNTIRNTRARGILIKASYGVIEGNTIEHIALAGIVLAPETHYWQEADYATDVVIRDNTLKDVLIGARNVGMIQAGAITVTAEGGADEHSAAGGHRNITIENNRIERAIGVNLQITSARDVVVRGNTFVDPLRVAGGHGTRFGVAPGALVWVSKTNGVTFSDNTIVNPGQHLRQVLVTTETAENINGAEQGFQRR